jgi:tetratricopeptide (TPR) repeat protein
MSIYGDSFNIGQRSYRVSPNNYRPSYQNYPWHNGYWNNSYGWNPQIGYGRGFGGYGNYGGYGIRIGGLNIGLGGLGANFGGYGYGRYPLGWGYGGWGLGNSLYRSGYATYYNPYWIDGGAGYAYDYSQPVYVNRTESAPINSASRDFDEAVQAFKSGDYQTALTRVDLAIKSNPSDGVMHEFRALTQFALRDFTAAAATIHSVLAVGPGWDWATMASLYPDVEIYTAQLRALESAARSNASDAGTRFLLGYHYLTLGHPENAAKEFEAVSKLQTRDRVAKDLLALVDKSSQVAPSNDQAADRAESAEELRPRAEEPAEGTKPFSDEALVGNWKASREDGSNFDLDLRADKTYTWKFTRDNRNEDFSGTYSTEGSLLVLQRNDGGAMVGSLTPDGDGKFNFKLVGAPEEDAGLTFTR